MKAVELDEFRSGLLRELDAVHRLAYHLTLSVDQADDLVQETCLRALKSRSTFRSTERGQRPWLFQILHNVHRTRLGRKARQALDHDDLDSLPARLPDPLPDKIDWDHVDERLKRAIEQLTPPQRAVILLWAVEGLSYQEIADVVDVPIGTVMSRLYRARQMLAESAFDLAVERRMASGGPVAESAANPNAHSAAANDAIPGAGAEGLE